jgi:hypothetical protein
MHAPSATFFADKLMERTTFNVRVDSVCDEAHGVRSSASRDWTGNRSITTNPARTST